MAGIASNIFKQLIYVPEGSVIGTVLTDTSTANFSSTNVSSIAVQTAALIGDDEILVTPAGAETGKYWYAGTKVTFSNDTTVYYLKESVLLTTLATKTLVLDRPLVKALTTSHTASFDFTSETVVPKKLRRVSSNLELKKESYASNEINSHQQQVDYRIGAQTIDGTLSCELSSYTYGDFIAAALRKDFYSPVEFALGQVATLALAASGTVTGTGIVQANVAVITPSQSPDDRGTDSVTEANPAGSLAAHKFYGIRVGDIITISSVGLTTAAINGGSIASIPLLVLDKNITTQAITVIAANSAESCVFTAGNIVAGVKFQVLGKKSFIPQTNHTKKSFQFEQYYADISRDRTDGVNEPYSELFKGVRVGQASIKLPTSGLATLDLTLMGTGMDTPTTATVKWDGSTSTVGAWDKTKSMMEILSGDAPLEPAIDSVYSSAVGNLYIKDKKGSNGKIYKVGLITSLDFSVNGQAQTLKVIGSITSPDVTLGKLAVQGNMSVYFQDTLFRDIFLNSEDATLIATFTESSSNTINSSFMNFVFPRIKTGGASKDDAQSIVMTVPFTALLADTTQGYEATTLQIQDYSQLA